MSTRSTVRQRRKADTPTDHPVEQAPPSRVDEEEFVFDFLYRPHTVFGLLAFVVYIFHKTFQTTTPNQSTEITLKKSLAAAALAFLYYCMLQLRDGPLRRPHPAVWRVIHGIGILYLMLLVFFLAQPIDQVSEFLRLFDSRIGIPEQARSYGDDCRLYIPEAHELGISPFANIVNQVYDRFTIAHFAGWFIKALILRDYSLMWVASVSFEVLEVTFQHLFPNFNECWWDHLLLDVFGCNLLGMWVGMKAVKWLNGRHYDWTGNNLLSKQGYLGKMKRVVLQFTPYNWNAYQWQVFSSWRRLLIGVAVFTILLLGEMNAFFLKTVLVIPLDSDVNLYRLAFWSVMTYMSVFELYHFAEERTAKIGQNAWLATTLVMLELMLVVKHAYTTNMFTLVYPERFIVIGWVLMLAAMVILVLVKLQQNFIVMALGAEQVEKSNPHTLTGTKALLVRLNPGHRLLVLFERLLNRMARFLTYFVPLPFIVMLAIDCLRTFSAHPPPTPQGFPNLDHVFI